MIPQVCGRGLAKTGSPLRRSLVVSWALQICGCSIAGLAPASTWLASRMQSHVVARYFAPIHGDAVACDVGVRLSIGTSAYHSKLRRRSIFSREGPRPRVLFVRLGFSPLPWVGLVRVGGFSCRKNTVVLKDKLKNMRVLALWLAWRPSGRAVFMHIYGGCAHWACLWLVAGLR
jgi:hypothetical protein